jgi:hypothetical protein
MARLNTDIICCLRHLSLLQDHSEKKMGHAQELLLLLGTVCAYNARLPD